MLHPGTHEQPVTPRRPMSPWAIFGIVIGGCLVVAVIGVLVLAALMYPVMGQARSAARAASCQSNLKQLSTGLMMYMQDYGEVLPPATRWDQQLMPYVKNTTIFQCPERPDVPSGYAYNQRLNNISLAQVKTPAQTPALFESSLGFPGANDTLGSFTTPHSGRGHVGYVDGHVSRMNAAPNASTGLPAKPVKKRGK